MKAAVIFINLLIACSSHVINRRSLLSGHKSLGHGHHGHHQQHLRQHQRARNVFGRRVGRDGGHHHDESQNEIRSAPSGYLPAADDYEDDLAGYNADQAGARNDELAGYGDKNLAGYETGAVDRAEGRGQTQYGDDQYQYGDDQGQCEDDQYQYEEPSGAEPRNAENNLSSEEGYSVLGEVAASDQGRSAVDGYDGAPAVGSASNIDQRYAAPDTGRDADDGYGAPDVEGSGLEDTEESGARNMGGEYSAPVQDQDPSRNADDSYAAPDASRTADDEYGAPDQYAANQNGFPFAIVEGRQKAAAGARTAGQAEAVPEKEEAKVCPGGSLDVCVSVCPGMTARVYGACVQGCADRCDRFDQLS